MCGIAGIVRWSSERDDIQLIQDMTEVMRHRGPNDSGFLLTNSKRKGPPNCQFVRSSARIALGHRRLSILDLSSAGRQPMTKAGTKIWILHNGEVYNYLELRQELEKYGYQFTTGTDTEVLLTAYDKWGSNFITRCNGMFATAILDFESGNISIYRDRMGIKPLYFFCDRNHFIFGSEIKALLEDSDVPRKVNSSAVYAYLCRQMVDHCDETFFDGIKSLRPGHEMKINIYSQKIATKSYYNLIDSALSRKDFDDPLLSLKNSFERAVKYRLRSDVRVGACLSGGLDSSSIVCKVDQLLSTNNAEMASVGNQLITFSSCHEEAMYDERQYIKAVTEPRHIKPIFVFPKADDLASELDHLVWHQDEPFSSPSIYGQYCLMKSARQEGVVVLLDGQGGDELFLGYRKFFFFYLKQLLKQWDFVKAFKELKGAMEDGDEDLFNFRAAKRYFPRFIRRLNHSIYSILDKDFLNILKRSDPAIGKGASLVERQVADIEKFSLPALLRYEDRNSMAFSIEARIPFLDHELVELALGLPAFLKIKNGVAKFLLRKAVEDFVPLKIVNRRTKMGFVMPEDNWFHDSLADLVEEALNRSSGILPYFLQQDKVLTAFQGYKLKQRIGIDSRDFFRMLCLDFWARTFSVSF